MSTDDRPVWYFTNGKAPCPVCGGVGSCLRRRGTTEVACFRQSTTARGERGREFANDRSRFWLFDLPEPPNPWAYHGRPAKVGGLTGRPVDDDARGITCAQCGTWKKWEPSPKGGRPPRFCSPACQKAHARGVPAGASRRREMSFKCERCGVKATAGRYGDSVPTRPPTMCRECRGEVRRAKQRATWASRRDRHAEMRRWRNRLKYDRNAPRPVRYDDDATEEWCEECGQTYRRPWEVTIDHNEAVCTGCGYPTPLRRCHYPGGTVLSELCEVCE